MTAELRLERRLRELRGLARTVRELVAERGRPSVRVVARVLDVLAVVVLFLGAQLVGLVIAYPWVLIPPVVTLIRALGVTVQTGQTGLLFHFGFAAKVLEPGFRPLIPFLQVVRRVPTRSRTLELSDQRVVTDGGLVYLVRANLVWRVVDVHRALIQIDDLEDGMRQALTLAVQEVLREAGGPRVRLAPELDEELAARMETVLERWGVHCERAGFQSAFPSPVTLRLVQIRERVAARTKAVERMCDAGLSVPGACALLATPSLPRRRQVRATVRTLESRRTIARRRLARQVRSEYGVKPVAAL